MAAVFFEISVKMLVIALIGNTARTDSRIENTIVKEIVLLIALIGSLMFFISTFFLIFIK